MMDALERGLIGWDSRLTQARQDAQAAIAMCVQAEAEAKEYFAEARDAEERRSQRETDFIRRMR